MGVQMTEADYIAEVCRQNPLSDTVDWLVRSSEDHYHADRHVDLPPDGVPARAACSAGLALLTRWADELEGIHSRGIYSEGPVLVIDQAWLNETLDAPPPHVILALAKREDALHTLGISGQAVKPSDSPIGDLLSGTLRQIKVTRIEPCEERESDGCWLFQFVTPSPDSPPSIPHG